MAKRKSISKKTRFEVFKRDSFKCQYCGQSAPDVILHIDHIQPVSKDGNEDDILNLLTSCFDCNMGKSDRLLSDDSVIQKQKAQLDLLNERRVQLEMLRQWREGLKEIEDIGLSAAVESWDSMIHGYHLNEQGLKSLRKLINKFGLATVLDSIPKAEIYLKTDESGALVRESIEVAFQKLGGICRLSSMPSDRKDLYYIRGIARNRFAYLNEWKFLQWLEQAVAEGANTEDLKSLVLTSKNWTTFKDRLFDEMGWEEE